MTSVYGVTYIGARQQITKRLQEKGLITDDKLLYDVSCYATRVSDILVSIMFWCICDFTLIALGRWRYSVTFEFLMKVTLDALGQMFQSARGIMAWLGDCAKVYPNSQFSSYEVILFQTSKMCWRRHPFSHLYTCGTLPTLHVIIFGIWGIDCCFQFLIDDCVKKPTSQVDESSWSSSCSALQEI